MSLASQPGRHIPQQSTVPKASSRRLAMRAERAGKGKQEARRLLGRTVRKYFDGEPYDGEIVAYDVEA
jgi:hypothetical protein